MKLITSPEATSTLPEIDVGFSAGDAVRPNVARSEAVATPPLGVSVTLSIVVVALVAVMSMVVIAPPGQML